MGFVLHPQLRRDTYRIGGLALCEVQLMDNALFPWVVLVPRVAGVREITDLKPSERHLLMDESCRISECLQRLTQAEKMNVAALGNQVPQLHMHVIARKQADSAWPNPVWGKGRVHYSPIRRERLIAELREVFAF